MTAIDDQRSCLSAYGSGPHRDYRGWSGSDPMNGTRKRLALRFVPEQGDQVERAMPDLGGTMSPKQFATIRKRAGLTIRQLADVLRIDDERTVIRYEKGERPVSGPVSIVMEFIADGRF